MSHTNKTSRLLAIRVPVDLLAHIRSAAAAEDLDNSKFIRKAIREKIARSTKSNPFRQ